MGPKHALDKGIAYSHLKWSLPRSFSIFGVSQRPVLFSFLFVFILQVSLLPKATPSRK